MRATTFRSTMTAVVVTPLVAMGMNMGAGTASAATPPTISVQTVGTDTWSVSVDGTATPFADPTLCYVSIGIVTHGVAAAAFTTTLSNSDVAALGTGTHQVSAECPPNSGNKSATLQLYSPRDPINDMRTQFSSDSQGMYGS
ncbi:MAG: hypothetical protein GX610_15155 [Rhodococcus sp.]|nr:hypothetical protein [Rhodococcus sp. (in: high G+C Gram-positive bacteria)]